jgi:quercetin dioxygenase-like cupin family protein
VSCSRNHFNKAQKEAAVFEKCSDDGYRNPLSGVEQKTLVHGEKTLMVEFRLEKGAALPVHSHPHEQIGYLVQGRMQLTIGTEIHDVAPGDSWCIPGGVFHNAEIIEDSVAVEVFAPVREEYLN